MNFVDLHPALAALRTIMLRTENTLPRRPRAAVWYRPIGSPSACAIRMSSPSTAPIFCRRRSATRTPNIATGHIPGAVFFDIEAVSDHSTELPHMLPGPTQFGEAVGALGIGDGDTVVVYDSTGLFSAARVWWTFRVFGAKSVYILDGGLPKWKAEGRPLETGDTKRAPKTIQGAR